MTVVGHCNCGSVTVTLPALPKSSLLCYCSNCRRAGSSIGSVNYLLNVGEFEIEDKNGTLKTYNDSNTTSGNTINRNFCGNCGSPIMTTTSNPTQKVIVKAGLYEQLPEPNFQNMEHEKAPWVNVVKTGEGEAKS